MKQCEECLIEKELTDFANSRHTIDGFQRRCKECRKQTRKENWIMKRQEGICTVYLLTNSINLKIYIGQTWRPIELRMGKNGNGYSNSPYIYNAIQKYGYENFKYTILAKCHDQVIADKLENEYMIQFNSRNPDIGYNIKEGGSVGKHSEETKNKMSKVMMGREVSEETRLKLSIANTGIKKPPMTEEWKQDNSIFMKQRHKEQGHPMQGKHHTPEACAKIGISNKEGWAEAHSPESIKRGAEKRTMKQERQQAIIQAYQNEKAIADIEIEFKTSRSSIYRILNRNNIPRRENHDQMLGKKHTEEMKSQQSKRKKDWWDNKKKDQK